MSWGRDLQRHQRWTKAIGITCGTKRFVKVPIDNKLCFSEKKSLRRADHCKDAAK